MPNSMNDFTDRCIPQDDAAEWQRVQLLQCDGCNGWHYQLYHHDDGRWLCGDCSEYGIPKDA